MDKYCEKSVQKYIRDTSKCVFAYSKKAKK